MKMQVITNMNTQCFIHSINSCFDNRRAFECLVTLIKISIVCLDLQTAYLEVVIPPDIIYGNFRVILVMFVL